jgi:hypothetical protein
VNHDQRPHLRAARVVAATAAVFWGYFFFGLQDTVTVFVEGSDFEAHYVMESGWGLLFLVLVAVPLAGLARRPASTVLSAQVAVVGVAVLVGASLAGSPPHALPGAGLLVTAAVMAGLARVDLRPRRRQVDRPLLVCALLAAVPASGYAWRMARSTADPELTWNLDHYPVQAALGVAVVLVTGLAAVADDQAGARLVLVTVVLTVAWMGVESAVYPDRLGSFGTTWAWLSVGWAVAVLVIGLRRARTT